MLVVMQQGATDEQIQAVIDRLVGLGFTVHRSTGVMHTVLGGVGPVDEMDPADFEAMEGVKECHRIVSPYKLASRHFKPQGTVIKIGKVEIGGPHVVTMAGARSVENRDQNAKGSEVGAAGGGPPVLPMAGPCSVETREQIEKVAEIVAAEGAQIMRGGAFKPRSSPYSFQGLGEEGLKMMRTAADRHGLLVVSEI